MSDGAISQDEIDALLAGVDMGGLSSSGSSAPSPEVHIDPSVFGTITANLASKLEQNLATMTGVSVSAGTPVVELVDRDKVLARIPEVVVSVTSDFSAGLHGEHLYLLSPEFAQKLTSLINKEENVPAILPETVMDVPARNSNAALDDKETPWLIIIVREASYIKSIPDTASNF